ncbi:MAG: ribonuclease HI [Bacteroidales bacterium]
MAKEITIYSDGASRGNPGPGGYGVVLLSGPHRKELSAGYSYTTNNRMELLGVIVGLEAIKRVPANITVISDSSYVVNAINKGWVFNWEKKANFAKKANPDLWKRFLTIYRKHHVTFKWVKGHDGNTYNEICDKLAVEAALDTPNLLIDEGMPKEDNKIF